MKPKQIVEKPCCPCCEQREILLEAARSALYLIRNDVTNIGKVVAEQLREALRRSNGHGGREIGRLTAAVPNAEVWHVR